MLSVNVVNGNSSRLFEALNIEIVRTTTGGSNEPTRETLALRATVQGWQDGIDHFDMNFDTGTAYVMNSSGSTIGTYVLGEQGKFSPKVRTAGQSLGTSLPQ